MSKQITAIKWYLTGLFSYPIIALILVIVFLQESSLRGGPASFAGMSTLFLLPFYGFANEIHFIRERDQTILEISLLRSWKWIILGKMVAGLIGILPLLVADYILLLVNNALSYAIPVTLLLITYVSLGTLLSMLQSKNYGIFLIFAFFFLVPIGVLFTIDTLLGMKITPPETISLLFYYFATPLAQYYLSKKLISGNAIIYSNLSVLIDIIVLLISLIIFVKSEIK